MARKTVPIILMIAGAAILLGAVLFALDNVTSEEPEGLGTWISTVLGLLLGASTGIKGWLDWNKKETPSQITKNIALDNAQLATGEKGRNIQMKDSSQYIEQNIQNYYEAARIEVAFHPLHQLPQPPADFTGREELIAQLLADFQGGKGATITGLTGMGGIGKTVLGLVVAHQVAKDYPDAQIFIDLKGTTMPLSATDVMRHVILSFEPTMDLRALDDTGMANAYHSILHGKRALLFLDNARSSEQIASLRLPETCAMLVTSRWSFAVPGLQARRLDVMSEENAIAFLLELCPRIGEKADELAKACAYLPLALRISGSFLEENPQWPVKQYLERLDVRKERLSTFEDSRSQIDLSKEHPNLIATFEMSYNQLSEEDRKRWRMLGVFPTWFVANAAKAMWKLEKEETRKLLGVLLRYSLLDYDEAFSRYGLHDLLADYALSQMGAKEEHEVRLKHASYYKDVLTLATQRYLKGKGDESDESFFERIFSGVLLFDLERENIRAGQAWLSQNSNDIDCVELWNKYQDAYMIFGFRPHSREEIAWSHKGLDAARKLGNKQYEGFHLGNLGIAYRNLGDVRKAIELYEQALVIHREIGDRRGEGNALFNMGLDLYELEEKDRAIQLVKQALQIYEAIESPNAELARKKLNEWGAGE